MVDTHSQICNKLNLGSIQKKMGIKNFCVNQFHSICLLPNDYPGGFILVIETCFLLKDNYPKFINARLCHNLR